MTLARWLARIMGVRVLVAIAGMVAVLQLLDLFETATKIVERGQGLGGVLTYAALRTPHLVVQAAPIGVLAGALFAFGKLARENAVVTLRAGGMSIYRLVALASPAVLAVSAAVLVLGLWVAPHSDRALADWWRATTPVAQREAVGAQTFRLGLDIVMASPGDEAGRRLTDVTLYRRAPDGRLLARTHAARAEWGPDGWRLHDVAFEIYQPGAERRGVAAEAGWTKALSPGDVRALFSKESAASHGEAVRALKGGAASRPAATYRMQLDRMWAGPFAVFVMLLIAAPSALGSFRDGGGTRLMLASLAAGLLFLVADGVCVSLGAGGAAPAWLAAWAAPVLFAGGALTALLYLEG